MERRRTRGVRRGLKKRNLFTWLNFWGCLLHSIKIDMVPVPFKNLITKE